jgi:hypothetical protein
MKPFVKGLSSVAVASALILGLASTAQAQIAKSGSYSGWFGWHSFGTLTDLGGGITPLSRKVARPIANFAIG